MLSVFVGIVGLFAAAGDVDLRTSVHDMAQTARRGSIGVTVTNPGPGAAQGVVLGVQLPDGATDVVHEPECVPAGTAFFECRVGDMDPGRYDAAFSWARGGDDPQVVAASVGSLGNDPDRANNTATFDFSSPAPVLGRKVRVGRVSGVVRVRRRGQTSFTRLDGTSVVPVGSEVDTARGRVRLISAVGDDGDATQSAEFFAGRFVVTQGRRAGGLTKLRLSGPPPACGDSASTSARRRRLVWGDARGRFRTVGRHGASSVRGTRWLTEDRCGGTFVRVVEGRVDVRDFARRRTIRLSAGESYLARARR